MGSIGKHYDKKKKKKKKKKRKRKKKKKTQTMAWASYKFVDVTKLPAIWVKLLMLQIKDYDALLLERCNYKA